MTQIDHKVRQMQCGGGGMFCTCCDSTKAEAQSIENIKKGTVYILGQKAHSICRLICTFEQSNMHRTSDGNSSENFIPRGIKESRNGKFTFLGDRGR